MILREIKTLHAYNAWADNRIFDVLDTLPEEAYHKDLKSSHGGIHGTMVHLVGAEKIWLERWQGVTRPFLSENPPRSLEELREIWEKVGYETARWLGRMTGKKLNEKFSMKTLKGEVIKHRYWEAFQHLVNHSSYHRGQVVTMLRQIGEKPPRTDLILFYRETGRR